MTTNIYTIQIKPATKEVLDKQNKELFDITVKSNKTPFSPTWDMVWGVKQGTMTEAQYTELYREMMLNLMKRNPEVWDNFKNQSDWVLGCYCKPDQFCHRHLLKDYIIKWLRHKDHPVKDGGEIPLRKEYPKRKKIDPEMDGVDHINIYSKGKTELGRLLSNFARTPFNHPEYGRFESIEGFWYWAKTGYQHDELKGLYGYQAKMTGKDYEIIHDDNFVNEIKRAIELKIKQTPKIMELLKGNRLPFKHYYIFKDKESNADIVISPKEFKWIPYHILDISKKV